MKTTNQPRIAIFAMLMLFSTSIFAQDSERPMYVVATTMHWNMDNDDFKMSDWKATEKEFMDKVTKKNEHVMSARYYLHRFTADNTELLYVQAYASWDAIDKAGDRNEELSKEAWPDENARKEFFKKKSNYYADHHSDEIYATMPGAKVMKETPTKDLILYLRKGHFAFPKDGTNKEFEELNKEYVENVFHKNELIKGYYPNAHAWGADKTEFVEAFIVDSMDDLDDMLKKNGELFNAHWSDETKRKEFNKKAGKYLTGVHGDYIYSMVHGISE